MKGQILNTIYQCFEQWSTHLNPVCQRGCSTCCTQNVTMIAEEGVQLLHWIMEHDLSAWLCDSLEKVNDYPRPAQTTNALAKACMTGEDCLEDASGSDLPCPFLQEDICAIYPVRPFSCRLFLSTSRCSRQNPASLPEYYQDAAMAVSQILEHLGQRQYWGNMLDVLPAICARPEFQVIAQRLGSKKIVAAQSHLLLAEPLPAFLLDPDEGNPALKFIDRLLAISTQGRTLQEYCNLGWNR